MDEDKKQLIQIKSADAYNVVENASISDVRHPNDKNITSLLRCTYCYSSFSKRFNLNKHIRKVHKKEPESLKGNYKCTQCTSQFTHRSSLLRHVRKFHNDDKNAKHSHPTVIPLWDKLTPALPFNYTRDVMGGMYECPRCKVQYKSRKYRDEHYIKHFQNKTFVCSHCSKTFAQKCRMEMHFKTCTKKCENDEIVTEKVQVGHGENLGKPEDGLFEEYESALGGVVRKERLYFANHGNNLMNRLGSALKKVAERLELEKEKNRSVKVYLSLQAAFYKVADPNIVTDPAPFFNTEPITLFPGTDVSEIIDIFTSNLQQQIDNYQTNGSGWVLQNFLHLELNLCRFSTF